GVQQFLDDRIDVGIISPYRMQTLLLRQMIASDSFFRPLRKAISINTVDGFQGQERDLVIVSLVRSNDNGQIGFLRDLRRMNVAMTRARHKLIIVGNIETLKHNPFYKKLHDHIKAVEEKFASLF
ncbi:MAG: C-terminal helicase domain-containing protein, partial [Bacteroidales bacterium]|nr:C-terminal helicase domain-containing protein [Bacteroidales bacterium]